MSSVTLCCVSSAARHFLSLPVNSLAEQAKARKRLEQQVKGMAKELEASISDRDRLKENHQAVRQEMEEVKAELALTQAK